MPRLVPIGQVVCEKQIEQFKFADDNATPDDGCNVIGQKERFDQESKSTIYKCSLKIYVKYEIKQV